MFQSRYESRRPDHHFNPNQKSQPSIASIASDVSLKPKDTSKTKNVFVFDLDDTLIVGHTLKVDGGPHFAQEEMSIIKEKMKEAVMNRDEVWIVTANRGYRKQHLRKLFAPDPDNILGKIKFFNGFDIAQELSIPKDEMQVIHSNGKKAEFLAKKIAQDPILKKYNVNCVLFDDTESQIKNCELYSSGKIKITGCLVGDYKAKKLLCPIPDQPLSEVFSNLVSKLSFSDVKPIMTSDLQKHENKLNVRLFALEVKVIELEESAKSNPNQYLKLAQEMRQLHTTLVIEKEVFFANPTVNSLKSFKEQSIKAIDSVEKIAKEHRGWHTVHPILRGIVGLLAAITLIPALMVEKNSKHGFVQTFFAKPETDTKQKVSYFRRKFKEHIQELEDEPGNRTIMGGVK